MQSCHRVASNALRVSLVSVQASTYPTPEVAALMRELILGRRVTSTDKLSGASSAGAVGAASSSRERGANPTGAPSIGDWIGRPSMWAQVSPGARSPRGAGSGSG